MTVRPGEVIDLDVTAVGNSGVCIARHEGKVVLVRLALPGERVRARVTAVNSRMLRADVVAVHKASEYRVAPPCRYFGVCGGCDWQHADLAYQRRLKAAVVIEQLGHLGGVDQVNGHPLVDLEVEPLPGDGMRWRTRNRFHRVGPGQVGLYAARSTRVIEVDDCLIAASGSVAAARAASTVLSGDVSTVSHGGDIVVVDPRGGPLLEEFIAGRRFRLHAGGFWQVHEHAAARFVEVTRELAGLRPGDSLLDLYAGAGLFAGTLASDVGPLGSVVAVESGIDAVRDARRSLADLGNLEIVTADVPGWLVANAHARFDVVVADPPRAGIGPDVAAMVSAMARRAIVYVACEPSALARDTRTLSANGWRMSRLVAVDAFPMTAHVECIALFTKP